MHECYRQVDVYNSNRKQISGHKTMTPEQITNLRLNNQQVTSSKFTAAGELVNWMGAMQAQDLSMAKWAVGLRVPDSTEKSINVAIQKGEIIRTHALRPTWHFVTPADIHWMLDLSSSRIKAAMKSTDKILELDDAVFSKSNSVIENAFKQSRDLSRETIVEQLVANHISVAGNRVSHILMRAEMERIICSGSSNGNRQTYALLSERAPRTSTLNRDEALAKLATTYFSSHGPATLPDFTWWSGLTSGESKHALEMVKHNFVSEIINGTTYWFADIFQAAVNKKDRTFMLPAFDEFIISYRDRTAALHSENHSIAVSNNGVFRPVIVTNGKVTGIWRRTSKNNKNILETNFFLPEFQLAPSIVADAFQSFINFTGRQSEIL